VVAGAVAANRNKPAPEQEQPQGQQEPGPAAAEQPAVEAAPSTDEKLAAVAKLGELHASGVLTDEEFAQQKAQILGS
jgi:hypothetical protein